MSIGWTKMTKCPYDGQTNFGECHLISFYFQIFRIFCERSPQNKLHVSTNLIIFGPMDQKLWVFENFRRSLGKVGMCCSQQVRVDYMSKKRWEGGRIF